MPLKCARFPVSLGIYLEIKSKLKRKRNRTNWKGHQDGQKQEQNNPNASHSVVWILGIATQLCSLGDRINPNSDGLTECTKEIKHLRT